MYYSLKLKFKMKEFQLIFVSTMITDNIYHLDDGYIYYA